MAQRGHFSSVVTRAPRFRLENGLSLLLTRRNTPCGAFYITVMVKVSVTLLSYIF